MHSGYIPGDPSRPIGHNVYHNRYVEACQSIQNPHYPVRPKWTGWKSPFCGRVYRHLGHHAPVPELAVVGRWGLDL